MTEKPMTRRRAVEWQEKLFGRSHESMLPSICMSVRIGVNGSGDEWEPSLIRETLEMLKARIDTWEDSVCQKEAAVDDAVKNLVQATISEVTSYGWWQEALSEE